MAVVATLTLPAPSMPQDVKVAPDGHVFYVADMMHNGVWLVDGTRLRTRGFLHTGAGAHGEFVSRDSRLLYVSNRGAGSVSRIDMRTDRVVGTWRLPGGGSPDMGGLSADGHVLWLSGRYDGVVYAISAVDGRLLARIRVGSGPHGLCVFPQPGRYSLGHTGVFR
jgi:DNA-binding beta-propeller fold protein YncE